MQNFLNQIITDLKIKLSEEFDRNFERKAFFDKAWPGTRHPNRIGSLLMRTGALRRSMQCKKEGNTLRFTSSEPYAALHNEGGQMVVTPKMKRYFWAMYYKASGGLTHNTKSNRRLIVFYLFRWTLLQSLLETLAKLLKIGQ